jgi:hypothetical protein
MNTREIELAIARLFNYRQCLIVPNVSWGLSGLGHECDVLVVRPSGYAIEIEIKISKSDLIKDLKKWHCHKSNLIRQLWFAIPSQLSDSIGLIPEHAGVLSASTNHGYVRFNTVRTARVNRDCRKLTNEEIAKISSLGCMRIWTLKSSLEKERKRIMSPHYGKSTLEASHWCKVCGRTTMHRVDTGRLGPCNEHAAAADPIKYPSNKQVQQEEQLDLFSQH